MGMSYYNRSQKLFILDGSCANVVFTLTTGAFLSGFASSLDASTQLIGVIAALPTLLNVTQVVSSLIFENRESKKNIIAIMAFLNRFILAVMFFIPLFVENRTLRLVSLFVMYGSAYFFNSFIGTAAGSWLLSLVSKEGAGKYLGKRDSVSLGVVTVISLVMGRVLDWFRGMEKESLGFFVIGGMILVFGLLNFYSLMHIEEPPMEKKEKKLSFKEVITKPIQDRKFRKVIAFYTFWNIALNIAGPFFSIYMVLGLKLDYFYIVTMTLLSSAARVCASVIWGKLADRISWMWVTKCSIGLLGVIHGVWMFVTPETYSFMMPVVQIASGIAWGGIAISTFNIQYTYAPIESRVSYVSLNTAFTGLCGFFATILGSALLSGLGEMKIGLIIIGGMQQLFFLSGIGMLGCVVFLFLAFQDKGKGCINMQNKRNNMYNYRKLLDYLRKLRYTMQNR